MIINLQFMWVNYAVASYISPICAMLSVAGGRPFPDCVLSGRPPASRPGRGTGVTAGRPGNLANLQKATAARTAATTGRAEAALDHMLRTGQPITFRGLAAAARRSRATRSYTLSGRHGGKRLPPARFTNTGA